MNDNILQVGLTVSEYYSPLPKTKFGFGYVIIKVIIFVFFADRWTTKT